MLRSRLIKIMEQVGWDGLDYFLTVSADYKGTPIEEKIDAYIKAHQELSIAIGLVCIEHKVKDTLL